MKERASRSEGQPSHRGTHFPEKRRGRLIVSAEEILRNVREEPFRRKEKVVFKKEETKEILQIATAIGDILYTPETGEALINGITRKLKPSVRMLWETFYTSPGRVFTTRELQSRVDPSGYEAGLQSRTIGMLISRLRNDICDYDREVIRTHGRYGYLFAPLENEENRDEWQRYQTTVGEVKYNSKTFQIRIANGEPIALTASMVPVWEEIISKPGRKVPSDELFFGAEKTESSNRMLMYRLQKRLGANILSGTYDRGYSLAVPEKKAKLHITYNSENHQVVINSNDPVRLSTYEAVVWERLFANPGKYLDVDTLSSIVPLAPGSIMQRLRLKLGDSEKKIIKNVPGKGYYLNLPQ